MARERLVIIGNGMASLRFLERLRQTAPNRFDVTVVGAEPSPAYNRVLLSSLLAG
jgi:nitrite reductase (NADH) large subunit